jgi:hypothetical protein
MLIYSNDILKISCETIFDQGDICFLRRIRKNSVEHNRKKRNYEKIQKRVHFIYVERMRKKIDVLEHTREMMYATMYDGRTK